MTVTINGTTGVTAPEVTLDNSSADGGQVVLKSSGYSNWNWDNYSGNLRAYYGSTEAMRIDSSGNVGIGVTPSAWTASGAKNFEFGAVGNAIGGAAVDVWISNNCYYNTGAWRYAATNTATKYESYNGAFAWYTAPSGTAGNAITFTQAMTLDSSGNLLVGKTSAAAQSVGFEARPTGEVNSAATASTNGSATTWNTYSTGAAAYRFYVGMGGTVYATSTTISAISDRRYKENIRDLDAGLNEVLALKPRVFDWKEGKGKDIKNDRGFIAQEFEQVFPDLIDEWKDPAPEGEEPYKSVRQDLIPVLVKAIQEQQAQIEALAAKVAALEAK